MFPGKPPQPSLPCVLSLINQDAEWGEVCWHHPACSGCIKNGHKLAEVLKSLNYPPPPTALSFFRPAEASMWILPAHLSAGCYADVSSSSCGCRFESSEQGSRRVKEKQQYGSVSGRARRKAAEALQHFRHRSAPPCSRRKNLLFVLLKVTSLP